MATTNLSVYKPEMVPTGKGKRFALVVSEWNTEVTTALMEGARETLLRYEVKPEDISIHWVSGSFELIYASSYISNMDGVPDCIIALGSIVRGETPHFDYISQSVAINLGTINAMGGTPVIMGVLTTDTIEQALDRAGGKYGNKGVEAAVTALKLLKSCGQV